MNAIIEIFCCFISVLFSTVFYNLCYIKLTFNRLIINFKSIFVIILTAFLIFINNAYDNLWLKFILTSLIFCLNFKILYNDNWKKTIINYIIIYITIILIEIIFSNILLKIGILETSEVTMFYTISKIIISSLISVIEYLIFSISVINNATKKLALFFTNNVNASNIVYLLFITCAILGMFNIKNFASINSTSLIILLILIFAILFVIVIKSKTQEEFLKESNKRLEDYNEKYGKFLDEYKIYKHNMKHKLAGMKAFGNKKINALIDDLLEEETTFTIKNNNIYNVPKEIKGIVAERLYNSKIDVIVDNKLKGNPFKSMNAKEFNNISESIGICLDNAVEASLETTNPIVTLDLYEDNEYVYIKTGNNFSNTIDIDELGDKYYSTKNRGSGLGLFSLKQNKFIQEKISIINDFYYIELKIKKHADN